MTSEKKKRYVPVTVPLNPVLQVGVQVVPLGESGVQSPASPLFTEGSPGQGTSTQDPEILQKKLENHEKSRKKKLDSTRLDSKMKN